MAKEFAAEYGMSTSTSYRLKNASNFSINLRRLIRDGHVGTYSLDKAGNFDDNRQERLYGLLKYIMDQHGIKTVARPQCREIIEKIAAGLSDWKIKEEIDGWFVTEPAEATTQKKRTGYFRFRAKDYFGEDLTSKEKGDIFETWCMDRLEQVGYSCRETHRNQDGGADIIARFSFLKFLIECKSTYTFGRYVDQDVVERLYRANEIYKCHHCIIITNAQYTERAKVKAKELGIILWRDGDIQ